MDDLFNDLKLPNVLYHYTDTHGLLGILKHKQLWLTHHSFLNDSTEIQYGKELIKQFVSENKEMIPEVSFNNWLENFELRKEAKKRQTFVVCFSENGDQLSQWRAYADDGLGFAIGFDTAALKQLAGSLGWFYGPNRVVYDRERQKELLRTCIRTGIIEKDGNSFEIWRPLIELIANTFKDLAFSEEVEWRMTTIFVNEPNTSFDISKENASPDFRPTKYGIAPFVRLNFPSKAIVEIVIGPRCPMREKHWVISQLLNHNEIDPATKITNSKSTYR